ncbi:MAG: CCA tRNA nucleotidyltransferase [Parvularculaceae bacterium]
MSEARPWLTLGAADRAHFEWTARAPVQKIVHALELARPGASRFVGGCVRDSLLGETPKDIDIATALTPEAVIGALHAAGLSAAPTGLDHGTVTGIADHVGVEITTLRADVATDGRRATVAYTEDWSVDAARRDFRLNAIYLAFDGKLFDPVGGVADAKAGRVRFIGEPADRICEDYLRILRFFRFSARFASGFDAEGLAACAAFARGMDILSAERVGDEFCRILAHPNAPLAVDAMAATGVLVEVWPNAADRKTFRRLKELDPSAAAPVGIAALFGAGDEGLDRRLRLSKANAARRKRALQSAEAAPSMSLKAARAHLYRAGVQSYRDGLLVCRARGAPGDWAMLASVPDRHAPPPFTVSGKHVVALGVAPGPDVAATAKDVEARWIAEDFPGEPRLQELLREAVARRGAV